MVATDGSTVGHVRITATLTGYAYETIPKKAIITGKTKEPERCGPFSAIEIHQFQQFRPFQWGMPLPISEIILK